MGVNQADCSFGYRLLLLIQEARGEGGGYNCQRSYLCFNDTMWYYGARLNVAFSVFIDVLDVTLMVMIAKDRGERRTGEREKVIAISVHSYLLTIE